MLKLVVSRVRKFFRTACGLRYGIALALLAASGLTGGCQTTPLPAKTDPVLTLNKAFGAEQPELWAEDLPGVMRYLDFLPEEKKICLTLDACGSKNDGYDQDLLDFLIAEKIHASLFLNARWIDKNREIFQTLSTNPLFDIQNHGQNHLPASVNGRSVYGLHGTANIEELVAEVVACKQKIAGMTGKEPTYYRSGTAFYDELAIKVVNHVGQQVAGFSVLGDAGCTYTAEQIKQTIALVQPNDIIIAHMNHPDKETAEGLIPAIKQLKEQGYDFVTLSGAPTLHSPPAGYTYSNRNLALDINVYPLGSGAHKHRE